MTDTTGGIHSEHPFATPEEDRDPVRRFRGRLAAPVTIATASSKETRAGLTVSSILVADGEPARVVFLVGPTSDFYEAMSGSGRFVVHVLEKPHRNIGDRFAGLVPSPGGPFAGLEVFDGHWGPELVEIRTRLYCTFESGTDSTYHIVVEGFVDRTDLHDLIEPLVYYRGRYRGLDV